LSFARRSPTPASLDIFKSSKIIIINISSGFGHPSCVIEDGLCCVCMSNKDADGNHVSSCVCKEASEHLLAHQQAPRDMEESYGQEMRTRGAQLESRTLVRTSLEALRHDTLAREVAEPLSSRDRVAGFSKPTNLMLASDMRSRIGCHTGTGTMRLFSGVSGKWDMVYSETYSSAISNDICTTSGEP
jgi:hypothetical protein